MKANIQNIALGYRGSVIIFAALILVLLTSCPIKSSLKTFAGFPSNTEQRAPMGKQGISMSSNERCTLESASETQAMPQSVVNNILPAVLTVFAVLLVVNFSPFSKETKHPVYSGSAKVSNSIPLFLAYRKLILHFIY